MIKKAIIYAFKADADAIQADALDASLQACAFKPCGAAQEKSSGWVPPRGHNFGALAESVAGQVILKLAIETKSVPKQAVDRALADRIAKIDEQEGRKPGRKETRELRDQIITDLLPHAFPKTSNVMVWIDPVREIIVIDAGSQSKADEATTALCQCVPGIKISLLNTVTSPQAAMTQWLTGEQDQWPAGFAPGRFVELHSGDEMKSVVKFDRHHLDDEQMRLHIGQGKLPTKLAMDWQGRVSFVLTHGTQLRKIELDVPSGDQTSDGDGFDADVAISTSEIGNMIDDLVAALGGKL